MPDLVGKTLGSYRIVEQIGLGGMATVYKAYQPSMDRYVALKILSTHLSQAPTFIKRFQQEARVIARLEHLHILPVYDHGEEDGYLYLVMRFIQAGTLTDRLKHGALSLAETRRVVTQIGSALEYAHQLGVIHRDLKPSNILVDRQGDCYLTDFGIAKIAEGTLGLTHSGIIGTPQYMAPEQGESVKVDHRADIYAMGVVIYEMVTGRLPFDAETPFAVLLKHLTEPLPLPRLIRPELPEQVELVILKALAKNPVDRFQTMRDLVTVFDQAVQAAPAEGGTAIPSVLAPFPLVVTPGTTAPDTASLAPQPVRLTMPPLWILAAAGLGLVVLVLAGLILSQVPGRVEISGGQVQVILSTATVAPANEGTVPTAPTVGAAKITSEPPKPSQPPATPTSTTISQDEAYIRAFLTQTPATLTVNVTLTPAATPRPVSPAGQARALASVYVVTDETWKFSRSLASGWTQLDYDDSGWPEAGSQPCQEIPGPWAGCLWDYPYRFKQNNALYFRKKFNLDRLPPRARLVTLVDDDVDVYLNGKLALRDDTGGISWLETDVAGRLRSGPNVLAFRGVDTGEGAASVQSVLGLCYEEKDLYKPLVQIMNHWEDWFDGRLYIEAVDAPCDSGVVEIAYQVDGAPWQVVKWHQYFRLTPGEHDVTARATDGAGRQAFDSWHFRIGQPPEATDTAPAEKTAPSPP